MKYLCIGYFDSAKMGALPKARIDAIMSECPAHLATFRATGQVLVEAGVGNEAKHLRRAGGMVAVADGSGHRGPERIGCVWVVEAADMNEASRIASLHPTTQLDAGEHLGWRIEVRPVHTFAVRDLAKT